MFFKIIFNTTIYYIYYESMAILEFITVHWDDDLWNLELHIDGEKAAEISIWPEMQVWEIVAQVTRALQWLPKELETTCAWVRALIQILLPKCIVIKSWDKEEYIQERFAEIIKKMEWNLKQAILQPGIWSRLQWLLVQNGFMESWNTSAFDSWKFLEEEGVFYKIYSCPVITQEQALELLRVHLNTSNIWTKTFELLFDVLRNSWFYIWS